MFALDSNTLTYYFKGEGRVMARMSARAPSEIGIPVVVLHEIETGIAKSGTDYTVTLASRCCTLVICRSTSRA